MGTDFTVIVDGMVHVGDDRREKLPGRFVGREPQFTFSCPDVDPDQPAVLLFQSRDVDHPRNQISINGSQLQLPFAGIPLSRSRKDWTATVMPVTNTGILREESVLRVEARPKRPAKRRVDDFSLDNVVIFYKTQSFPGGGVVVG